MSRNNRNTKGTTKGNTTKDATSPARKGKGNATTIGRVLTTKGEDKDRRTMIEELLDTLQEQRESKDRDGQKGTRRKLRSLGYWGGTRTRTNWIGRVPDVKRPDVVSL